MKPPVLLLSFIASFAALLAAPASLVLAVAPVTVTGLLMMLSADYGRRARPLTAGVKVAPRAERLPYAA